MNANIFSEWLRKQGHNVYRTQSSYWYDAGPHTLQAFPYHWVIQPSEMELSKLMLSKGILSLRYSTPLESHEGKASYHVEVLRPYTLEGLKPQARNGVKKGQACFHVEQIPFTRLADEGWFLQHDTLERQNRLCSMKQETWKKICLAAVDLPGFEAWAAIADGELAGALFTARIDDIVCVPYALSRTKYLHEHVNNVLFFDTCCNLLSRSDISKIFLTVQSLDAPESVDEFKFRMSFTPKPIRQRVVLHPLITPLATNAGYHTVKKMCARHPGSNVVAKTEGMLRYHILGKLPLTVQEWPECVAQYKNELIFDETKELKMETLSAERSNHKNGHKPQLEGCQIPGYQRVAEGVVVEGSPSPFRLLKRTLARPWNYLVKPQLKNIVKQLYAWKTSLSPRVELVPVTGNHPVQQAPLHSGDLVRVRGREEIESSLDPFKELKGCAFLDNMWQYCDTTQRVLQPMERFLDERDYKVKKTRGVVLLDGILCRGTPVFGRCDRCCHLFWREEWLEKIEE